MGAHLRPEGERAAGLTDRCQEAENRFSIFTFRGPSLQVCNLVKQRKGEEERKSYYRGCVIFYVTKNNTVLYEDVLNCLTTEQKHDMDSNSSSGVIQVCGSPKNTH